MADLVEQPVSRGSVCLAAGVIKSELEIVSEVCGGLKTKLTDLHTSNLGVTPKSSEENPRVLLLG